MRIPAALFALAMVLAVLPNRRAEAVSGTFHLTVPELKVEVSENGTATIADSFVRRLELRVLKSSQEIAPGKVIVRINGVAANTVMSTRTLGTEIVCDLDLYFRPGFLLQSGRNTIEASAESIYGRYYYAAFFLDTRDEPDTLREIERETTVSQEGEDAPLLHLTSPEGPVMDVPQLSVQGYVDGGTAPITVQVQGVNVRLVTGALPAGARGVQLATDRKVLNFTVQAKIAPNQDFIEVTATDAHNNRSRWRVPVIHASRTNGKRYAVVIGVSRYQDKRIRSLDFADRDAEAVRDFLLDPNGGGVSPGNLLYLVNQDATSTRIRYALFDFLTKPGPEDLAFVYFAGHGAADPKRQDNYYLLSYDTEMKSIGATAVPMSDLISSFTRTVQASVVSLVDACHSGAVGETLPNIANQRWINLGYGQHRAIITASRSNEFSQEGSQWGGGHGVFTYFLLRGLQGEADVKHDHQISVGALFDFVKDHVKAETTGQQTPTAMAGLERGLVVTHSAPKAADNSPPADWFVTGGTAR